MTIPRIGYKHMNFREGSIFWNYKNGQNKMLSMMKEPEDMTLIGPVIEKQQKIVNDCVEKKLTLSKLQASIWEKSNTASNESFSLTDLDVDDDIIKNLIAKDTDKTSGSYKMKK